MSAQAVIRPLARGLAAALLILSSVSAALAAGGDDGTFGYSWRDNADGATYDVVDWDSSTTIMIPAENLSPVIDLGFAGGFEFYGVRYNRIQVSDNGWLAFVPPPPAGADPVPTPLPSMLGPGGILAMYWRDLQNAPVGRVVYGRNAALDAFRLQYTALDPVLFQTFFMDVILYANGTIKMQWETPPAFGNETIGIESEDEMHGIQIRAGGAFATGVAFSANYVIEFIPPPILPPNCATIPGGACRTIMGTSPAPGDNVVTWGCGGGAYFAQEAVYSFDVTEPSIVDITLTSGSAGLTSFLLSECNERRCIGGPATSHQVDLGPGTYWIAVDGPTVADEGSFTLDVACSAIGVPAACGDIISSNSAGAPTRWNGYACAPTRSLIGPELAYSVDIATNTNLRATLTVGDVQHDVLILEAGGTVGPSTCIAWGDRQVVAWNVQPGQYLVVVDGFSGFSGPFTLEIECFRELDCSMLEGTIDLMGMGRSQVISGNTVGGIDSAQVYACDPLFSYGGTEDIWEITLPAPGHVAVSSLGGTGNVSFFITDGCNEGGCVGLARIDRACSTPVEPGTYYLVVDSPAGQEGSYQALVVYEESFNRWTECELPSAGTTDMDITSTQWNWNDAAYCYTDPTSVNYPDGCSFSMYAIANCGTALHLPLFDVESGHLRVFDVFRGRYVLLTALSGGGFFQQGTEIQWQDCTGTDPRWDNTVTDVYFERPTGLCGVFRIEFINHAGFEWQLFANCDGSATPLFNISDNLCTALDQYEPLPDVSITVVSETYSCPAGTFVYDVTNNGCVGVTNFVVELRDSATPITTDVVPFIGPGQTVRRTMMVAMLPVPAFSLALWVDPNNLEIECVERGQACGIVDGGENAPLLGCSLSCSVRAAGVATPDAICETDTVTTVTIDASTSAVSGCTSALEYALFDGVTTTMYQMSPIFAGLRPTLMTDYRIFARCIDDPTCEGSSRVPVIIDRPPDLDPASVIARDAFPCNQGVIVSWDPATFYGPSGTGTYNIYRGEVGCAPADVTLLHANWSMGTTYPDNPPTPDTASYYYVVEAEDDNRMTSCTPPGPVYGGSTTRVAANGGGCTPVIDRTISAPETLPRVGTGLRLGGTDPAGTPRYSQAHVYLYWTTDVPLDVPAEEHFHVHRTDTLGAPFPLISVEPPRRSIPEYLDLTADQPDGVPVHVLYYLVFTADGCDQDNSEFDNFASMP